jgi:hypothetical protein
LSPSDELVLIELNDVENDVAQRRTATEQGWTVLFTNRPLFNRLWRASLLQFMAQMCGNTSMKYYLPSIFMSLGIERKLTLMIGSIENALKIGCTVIDTWMVDRYGRRLTLVLSCLVMSAALLVSHLPTADLFRLTAPSAKRCVTDCVSEQHQSRSRLCVYPVHLYLHFRL